jgi:cation diffusion facilitator family transporter
MPDPQPHPEAGEVKKVARNALVAGVVIMALKFGVFGLTHSVTVLSDAVESIINLAAAAMMMYSLWLSNRPADADHPYGHGKVEFMAVGLEGWMILTAGVVIVYQAVRRFFYPPDSLPHLLVGTWVLGGIAVLAAALAAYVWLNGRHFNNATLLADGKHLMTDVASTLGGILGLTLIQYTGKMWLDPLVALLTASVILFTSWHLLWMSIHGLMDRVDPADEAAIRAILDDEITTGAIKGYHKVRHRHNGAFHWVDMHLQVDGNLSVKEGHELASRIEYRVEQALTPGNATAHLEPFEPAAADTPGPA